ncbi:hypothetical protein Nepgr_009934 [Nepenthes gracilis]|uniref:Uncharacterized protein n=1 Tax=Nepenthes gracilis TaxID=150966 RepID=A0AAD3SC66_NEPGR|nr:hypothetical protein Nepgr_009934 [Nepenthes gracilis]
MNSASQDGCLVISNPNEGPLLPIFRVNCRLQVPVVGDKQYFLVFRGALDCVLQTDANGFSFFDCQNLPRTCYWGSKTFHYGDIALAIWFSLVNRLLQLPTIPQNR